MKKYKNKFIMSFVIMTLIFSFNLNYINAVVKGDINKDGVLTKDDALLIVEKTVNATISQEDIDIADLNCDGILNVSDAQALMKQIDSTFRIGDYNKDGKLTMIDYSTILKIAVLNDKDACDYETILYCDVSGDGIIRMYDAIQVGKVVMLPGYMNDDFRSDEEDALIIIDKVINNDITEEDISKGDVDEDGALTIKDAQIIMEKRAEEDMTEFVLGDYNQDEIFSEKDIQELLNYLSDNGGSSKEPEVILYCDMNADGVVDSKDTLLMMKSIPAKGDLDANGIVNANDAAIALDLYKYGEVTKQRLYVGDMDNNGIINANDAALILDVYKYGE